MTPTFFRPFVLGVLLMTGWDGTAQDDVAPEPVIGVKEYTVHYEDGKLESREVFQKVLELTGSSVELPDDFPTVKVPVHPVAAGVTIKIWNTLLSEYGITFSRKKEGIHLRVDLVKIEGSLDEFEEGFTDFFGIERSWTLHHVTDDGRKGPVVVILHGLDSSMRFFNGTCKNLGKLGYDVYFFEYPNDDRVVRNARRLSQSLLELPEDRRKDISLVTVSMGGLISQYMIETEELYVPGVKRLIACVPPFQGSELAALRMVVELGDQTMNFFDFKRAASMFGDGMGRAGIDLQPGSLFMQKTDTLKRNPEVTYSIVAGSKGFVEVPMLEGVQKKLEEDKGANAVTETARKLLLEKVELLMDFQTGKGDGAVKLTSSVLEGVTDRVVLPNHHLEILSDLTGKDPAPGFDEVVKRLPPAPIPDGLGEEDTE
jgi:pimeloyl-ACP methyl ester carboxylesterase